MLSLPIFPMRSIPEANAGWIIAYLGGQAEDPCGSYPQEAKHCSRCELVYTNRGTSAATLAGAIRNGPSGIPGINCMKWKSRTVVERARCAGADSAKSFKIACISCQAGP